MKSICPSPVVGFPVLTLFASIAWSQTATTKPHDFNRWEKEIAAYEKADQANPPTKGGIVFTGASSIKMWKSIPEDFPGTNSINRGFGGSQMMDATHFADRLVLPYAPHMVVLRAGGNDIHAGRTPDQVFDDFKAFVSNVHAKLPTCQVVYLSQSATPSRWEEKDAVKKLNDLVEAWAKTAEGVKYVETWDIVMKPNGTPREELFLADRQHFNAEGNRLMADRLRPTILEK